MHAGAHGIDVDGALEHRGSGATISSLVYCKNRKRLRLNRLPSASIAGSIDTTVDFNSISTHHEHVNPFSPTYTTQQCKRKGKERKFTALEVQRFIDQAVQEREAQLREEFSNTLQKLLQGMYCC
uniref:Potassium-transporting ATPase C chain n=1 Tax=Lygus hesperus TaxID=30085 RepID=A0A0A9YGZ4_LYGHE